VSRYPRPLHQEQHAYDNNSGGAHCHCRRQTQLGIVRVRRAPTAPYSWFTAAPFGGRSPGCRAWARQTLPRHTTLSRARAAMFERSCAPRSAKWYRHALSGVVTSSVEPSPSRRSAAQHAPHDEKQTGPAQPQQPPPAFGPQPPPPKTILGMLNALFAFGSPHWGHWYSLGAWPMGVVNTNIASHFSQRYRYSAILAPLVQTSGFRAVRRSRRRTARITAPAFTQSRRQETSPADRQRRCVRSGQPGWRDPRAALVPTARPTPCRRAFRQPRQYVGPR